MSSEKAVAKALTLGAQATAQAIGTAVPSFPTQAVKPVAPEAKKEEPKVEPVKAQPPAPSVPHDKFEKDLRVLRDKIAPLPGGSQRVFKAGEFIKAGTLTNAKLKLFKERGVEFVVAE